MTLKKKITLGFFISASIIAVLVVFGYINFVEMRREIRNLEQSDIIRSKSLQLRRHEKNYFLYKDPRELDGVYRYLKELDSLLPETGPPDNRKQLSELKKLISEYRQRFNRIELIVWEFQRGLSNLSQTRHENAAFFPLMESTFLERPVINEELLQKLFGLKPDHPVLKNLEKLDLEINALRKNGEEILIISKDLDRAAREKVERSITLLQKAAFILFPLFLLAGFSALFALMQSIDKRLSMLTLALERTGRGDFSSLISVPGKEDEIGILISAFNRMENDLALRDEELRKKNEELFRSRKLASIGTLASGVAHELNNPLNNIYLSAQILQKEASESCSPFIKETLADIISQSIRVKRIVGDLLEYARGREPRFAPVELNELVRNAYRLLAVNTDEIHFVLNTDSEQVMISADSEQIERVFINLFTNAVEAMSGKGDIIVTITVEENRVKIWVSDTGKGMAPEEIEKVFEPFFTTKDKGTGLGLAIVFNIIKKHKGDIVVSSEKGRGTTFNIVLPAGE